MTYLDALVALAAQAAPHRRPVGYAAPTAGARRWFRMAAAGPDTTAVHVYDYIGGWDGITAVDFVQQLNAIDTARIDLHVNSGGGDVFDAIAMHAALVNHSAEVHSFVDGLAASAASFLFQAGVTRGVEKPGRVMIHDASGVTIGTAADHEKMQGILNDVSNTMAQMYADRAGGSVETWRDAMLDETWYGSQAAVDAGLADHVLNDTAAADSASDTDSDTDSEGPSGNRQRLIRARARARSGYTTKGARQ